MERSFLGEKRDLISQSKMFHFFGKMAPFYFKFKPEGLISLKIIPKNTMSGNILILYNLFLLKNKKRFWKKIWGKTMSSEQFKLFKFLEKTQVSKHIPDYIDYVTALKFSFSLDIGGKSTRTRERSFYFWEKNMGEIGNLLAEFQNLKIPKKALKIYRKQSERFFLQKSLKIIKRYFPGDAEKYKILGDYYLKAVFPFCWQEKKFSFCHFDFQPSNIFYIKKTGELKLLDFDLACQFHPALDFANFWVHFYVMGRYHFPQKRVLLLLDKFSRSYFQKSRHKEIVKTYFDTFRLRTIIDIAQITASAFKKPSPESKKVFVKLDEILNLIPI